MYYDQESQFISIQRVYSIKLGCAIETATALRQ
jgi:hypothetical protein